MLKCGELNLTVDFHPFWLLYVNLLLIQRSEKKTIYLNKSFIINSIFNKKKNETKSNITFFNYYLLLKIVHGVLLLFYLIIKDVICI